MYPIKVIPNIDEGAVPVIVHLKSGAALKALWIAEHGTMIGFFDRSTYPATLPYYTLGAWEHMTEIQIDDIYSWRFDIDNTVKP